LDGSPRTLPTEADEAGGTAVKFYELRDNLAFGYDAGQLAGIAFALAAATWLLRNNTLTAPATASAHA
jgi:hypothetical protein